MTTTHDMTTTSPLPHRTAVALQAAELERTITLLETLDVADWVAQTDCPAWDVRRMYLHVLGACESGASMKEMAHQMKAARSLQRDQGGPLEAALSAVQVRERDELSTDELVDRLRAVAPQVVRRRRSLPSPLRGGVRMKVDGPVFERWSLGYVVGTIYLRDLWLHRVDACRATGRPMALTPEHDGRIVSDVVAEWARRHRAPFRMELTGPAGGSFSARGGAEQPLVVDAVEFCRTVGGRAAGVGLLGTVVPF